MVGHLFGGVGAIEALACVYAVHTDTIHPTINYHTPDPECDLDYVPNVARDIRRSTWPCPTPLGWAARTLA